MKAKGVPLSDKKSSTEWLSLAGAAEILGVHPSTLRLWSDKGIIPVHRTQGGHRRYKREEVTLWAQTAREGRSIEPVNVLQSAARNIRLQISEGRLEAEPWYQKLDEQARIQYRQSARTLFQGLMNSLSADDATMNSEAHSIGYEYASRASRYGLNGTDATRAFLFFRRVLLESIISVYQDANIPSGQAWGSMLKQVHAFTDLVLLNLLETHQKLDAGK